jgi:prepilin-type N-terminal cleavage/methylation domain-containing protein
MSKRLRGAIDEGFTLIELLIVIIILGILAAIVVFAVGNTKKDAANASCVTDVKAIMLAEEAYKVHLDQGYASDSGTLTDSSSGNLKSWPGTTNMVFALGGTSTAYTLDISGSDVAGTGTGSAAAPLGPTSTDSDINGACAGA